MLEKLINDISHKKKIIMKIIKEIKKYSILSSENKNDIQNNEQISNLEKEISLLKRSLYKKMREIYLLPTGDFGLVQISNKFIIV